MPRCRSQNELMGLAAGCPEGSFGRAYADFMDSRRFEADERPPVHLSLSPPAPFVARLHPFAPL